MENQHYTKKITVSEPPSAVFNAITKVRDWWSNVFEGNTRHQDDEFEVWFGDVHYSKQRVTAIIPNEKITWLVTESELNFLNNKQEWNGTQIHFELTGDGKQTQIRFTHEGLVPDIECFKDCSNGWNYYLESLKNYITTGKGQPNLKKPKNKL